ncbi:MAG: PA14 domain-containing protein [Aquirufa sp.]
MSQVLAPMQAGIRQPNIELDYWVYSTYGGTGSTTQYTLPPTTKAEMDKLFNTDNSNSTIFRSGQTNSAKLLDWTSIAELSSIGISLPNSGNYFAMRIQGTFIPLETGSYTFSLETDDASDFIINGTNVVNRYAGQAVPTLGSTVGSISLNAGQKYRFEIRMQQGTGGFGLRFYWKSPSQNSAPTAYQSSLPANTYYQSWTQNLQELISNPDMDGSTAARAAPNAKYIQTAFSNYTDNVYWINLPFVGPTQIYCLLNSAIDGGGWMMIMKATRGTTFPYTSSYWTAVNTLNPTAYNRADGDAKFDSMNYFFAKDIMALWPDIASNYGSSTTGGSVNLSSSYNNWCWLQNNFNNGIRITPINFFASSTKLYFYDANNFAGKGTAFSSQVDVRFYGFNYANANTAAQVRWGFGWNENGGGLYPNGNEASNDVSGGIGMAWGSYSAGDYISCCQNITGINRTARVELYVR